MRNDNKKRSEKAKEVQQPGDLSSFNNRDEQRSTEAERAGEQKKGDKIETGNVTSKGVESKGGPMN